MSTFASPRTDDATNLPSWQRKCRIVGVAVVALACVATLTVSSVPPAEAGKGIRTPRSFTGYAFDRCISPNQRQMNTWWRTSPFGAVGIYISGAGRACPASVQPSLSPGWVRRQHQHGWRILPLHVGRQAPCFQSRLASPAVKASKPRMSSDPRRAHRQGVKAAEASASKARYYGLGRRSTLYLDIEWYPRTERRCNAAVLAHIDGWTERLHRLGYGSGLYSSASAAIQALDIARHADRKRYTWPDQLWFAWGNGRSDLRGRPYLSGDFWSPDRRLHQYQLDTAATYGHTRMTIDRNWMSVGKGSRAQRQTGTCGRRQSFDSYPTLRRGDTGKLVAAARCLLRRFDYTGKPVTSRYAPSTARAVRRLQVDRGLPVTGMLRTRSWMALLARGDSPLVKIGSDSQAVWRLQRALRAAGRPAPLTGRFGQATAAAVRTYEHRVDEPANGVVDGRLWRRLRSGRT